MGQLGNSGLELENACCALIVYLTRHILWHLCIHTHTHTLIQISSLKVATKKRKKKWGHTQICISLVMELEPFSWGLSDHTSGQNVFSNECFNFGFRNMLYFAWNSTKSSKHVNKYHHQMPFPANIMKTRSDEWLLLWRITPSIEDLRRNSSCTPSDKSLLVISAVEFFTSTTENPRNPNLGCQWHKCWGP